MAKNVIKVGYRFVITEEYSPCEFGYEVPAGATGTITEIFEDAVVAQMDKKFTGANESREVSWEEGTTLCDGLTAKKCFRSFTKPC